MVSVLDVVVVGFDGSPDAVDALAWAASLAARVGADVRVVHAVGLLEGAGLAAAAHEPAARRVATEAGLAPARVEWVVADGDACGVLLRHGRDAEAAGEAVLVVVGSRGAGARPGLMLGSTSMALVERSTVPVVVVPGRHRPAPSDP